jgi:adenosylcobinamide kinase/adenosylcobinamide-phosphate guanylyltransferase
MAERIIVVGGGVRSGKSRFALELALQRPGPRAFVATAQAYDGEMQRRISAHQQERGSAFTTYQAQLDLGVALRQAADARVIVVDCLTMFVSNLLLAWTDASAPDADASVQPKLELRIEAQLRATCAALTAVNGTVIMVTNEVGMGVVPASPLGRSFRDLLGLANQRFAGLADELYLATLGVVLRLKPEPVALAPRFALDEQSGAP